MAKHVPDRAAYGRGFDFFQTVRQGVRERSVLDIPLKAGSAEKAPCKREKNRRRFGGVEGRSADGAVLRFVLEANLNFARRSCYTAGCSYTAGRGGFRAGARLALSLRGGEL